MKKLSYAIAISMSLSGAVFAQDGALGTLLAGTPGTRVPVPAASPALPAELDRALASDVLDLTPNYADFLDGYAVSIGYKVFELDGARMTSKSALLDYSTRMLSLPGVPENWDAMIDYLGELRAIHGNNHILIVVRNSGRISKADSSLYADFREVAEFTCRNARDWSKGEITMKFAFVN